MTRLPPMILLITMVGSAALGLYLVPACIDSTIEVGHMEVSQ